MADDPMWSLVLFDLPVKTKKQRRDANHFRNDLLDRGFSRVQFSVYVKYWPTGVSHSNSSLTFIKTHLPPKGQVRILMLSDRQWSTGLKFYNAIPQTDEKTPQQLMIF